MSFVTSEQRTPQQLSELLAILQAQGYGQATMGALMGEYLSLPGLVGFWPGSAMGASGQLKDMSSNGLHLTNNNFAKFGADGGKAIVGFNGTNHYFSIASTAILNISGAENHLNALQGLTVGAWVYFDNVATAAEAIIYKADATNKSYYLQRRSSGGFQFGVFNTNVATTVNSTNALLAGAWCFVVGQFKPSTHLRVWFNGAYDQNTTSIPATIDTDPASFTIGASGTPDAYMDGNMALLFICAAAVPDDKILSLYHMGRRLFGA